MSYRESDVMLDTFPYGGGVTSIEAFSVGIPVITFNSEILAGRLTLALYNAMGINKPPVAHGKLLPRILFYNKRN